MADQIHKTQSEKMEMTEEEALRIVKLYRCPGGGPAGCVQVYDDTAGRYDQV